MADPEGFHAGSAWMDVKPNIDESEWHTKIAAAVGDASVSASPQIASGLSKGLDDAKPKLARDAGEVGKSIADGVAKGIGDGEAPIMDEAERIGKALGDNVAIQSTGRLRDARGRFVAAGQDIGDGIGKGVGDGVDPGLDDFEKKVKDKAKAAGKGAESNLSPLLLGAFTAVAAAGPAAIVAGLATGLVGAEALATRSNAQLAAQYQKLGTDGADAITRATDPLIPQMQASLDVLDQGINKAAPELKDMFAASAPYATEITSGVSSLVTNILPGVTSLLRDAQPYAHEIADDLGKIGSGVGGLFSGLGAGAGGGAAGLDALATGLEHLLPDIGQIAGDLSNGLGPALHDVVLVADAAGTGLKFFTDNLPSGAVRVAADAVAGLYAAFKVGKIAGVVGEGATFTQFLKGTVPAAEGAAGGLTKMTGAVSALSGGLLKMAPLIAGAGMLGNYLGKLAGVDKNLVPSVDALAVSMQDAAQGSGAAQDQITKLAQFVNIVPWKSGAAGISSIDQALTQLQANDPGSAATEFYQISQALQAQGKSAADVAAMFPQYEKALDDAKLAARGQADAITDSLSASQQFTQSLIGQQQQLAQQAGATGASTVAAMSFANTQGGLNQALADAISDYTLAKNAAGAYGTALSALAGSYGGMQAAEAQTDNNLQSLIKNQKQLGHSFTIGKGAGDQNVQMMNSYTQSITTAAQAIVQQDLQSGRSSQVTQDLTKYVYQQRDAFIQQEGKILGSKDAAEKLFDQYVDIKALGKISTQMTADTSQADSALHQFISRVDSATGTVQVYATVHNPGGGKALLPGVPAHAQGGPVTAGSLSTVGEHGQETVYFPQDAYVLTHGQTTAMQSRPATSPGPQIVNNFNYYGPSAPDPEQKASMLRDLAGVLA